MTKEIHSMASTNFAMFAYDTGFDDFRKQLLKEIDSEIQRLSKYGRTELYGLHKTREIAIKLSEPTQTKPAR